MAVSGQEHYFARLGDLTCTASPVRDAPGEIVGVLDASSYFESRQQHTQALVRMAATQLENGLLAHQMREHRLIAIHPRQEFLGTLSAGLLAFDHEGRFLAPTRAAASCCTDCTCAATARPSRNCSTSPSTACWRACTWAATCSCATRSAARSSHAASAGAGRAPTPRPPVVAGAARRDRRPARRATCDVVAAIRTSWRPSCWSSRRCA